MTTSHRATVVAYAAVLKSVPEYPFADIIGSTRVLMAQKKDITDVKDLDLLSFYPAPDENREQSNAVAVITAMSKFGLLPAFKAAEHLFPDNWSYLISVYSSAITVNVRSHSDDDPLSLDLSFTPCLGYFKAVVAGYENLCVNDESIAQHLRLRKVSKHLAYRTFGVPVGDDYVGDTGCAHDMGIYATVVKTAARVTESMVR